MTSPGHDLRRIAGRTATVATLVLATAAAVGPILWMVFAALKPESEIFASPPTLIPTTVTGSNFGALFGQFEFGPLTINSILVSAGVVVLSVGLGGLSAYGFSRYSFRGSSALLAGLLLTRMITPAALVVPLYLIMARLGLLNTVVSIVLGVSVLNLPFVVWLLKPFFDALPRDVEEAGLIDGLAPSGVFWRIAMPMAAPGLLTVAMFSVIAGWTDLLFPMSFTTTPDAMPLTAGLLQMQTGYRIYWGPLMAGGVYLTLPSLIICFVLQKYLIRGMRLSF